MSKPGGGFSMGWGGWALASAAVLTPLLGWLAPLGFAALAALVGLITLPGVRLTEQSRPFAVLLLATVTWASVSIVWSPYRPQAVDEYTALKLVLQLPLYWAVVCAAGNASPDSRTWFLRLFAYGAAALGAVLVVECFTQAIVYQTLRKAMGDPLRFDLAQAKVVQGAFVLALITPVAAIAAVRAARAPWLVVPMVLGVLASNVLFADAPILALGLAILTALAVWRWPMGAPLALAAGAAAFFMLAPLVIWGLIEAGLYAKLEAVFPVSWGMRLGYWRHAVGWIVDHPLRGWGLDASRMFAPGINLHPHDSALQLWLELGVAGALAAAVFWALVLTRLTRERPDAAAAACSASAVVYLTFGAVSFGVWQEWWLALGALTAAAGLAVQRQPVVARVKKVGAGAAPRSSTLAPVSE